MVNQVNNRNSHNVNFTDNKQAAQSSDKNSAVTPTQTATTNPKSAADSVVLTSQAQQLKNVQTKADEAPGFDAKKVNELKKAISEGSYQVNAEKLAKNIAQFEFNLYG
ncbi:negative regulator of flagellin synthesis FlgM [Pseudoalteromonas ulvae UL12]|uniref:Negative regulator of flagellin synthesis n=1 Tax=Pseudoalteromonas ulvae TaxID=107327 RepID=A0A244CSL1_PSEDV|nr:flagellar biosynthesis anti-sigma factor FlgM [Pseudoalteromonas ulvae]MBE0363758.1 negative regulator of flagellin synthesis FlgM [Pseudoalteromonas ulvae UL12]OUL58602.1 flagellar biosynthesis anti-sigma factor FlgM [Pseudoalteromonas ulvae]